MIMNSFNDILKAAKHSGARRIVIPSPAREDIDVLSRAAASGLVIPRFIGETKSLKAIVGKSPLFPAGAEIISADNPQDALNLAIEQLKKGETDILMQGGINPQVLLDTLQDKSTGLKTSRTISYVSLFQHFSKDKLMLVTDTFCNNFPHVAEKQGILENALNLARTLGMEAPKVAVLAAIEQVNPAIASTLDAAILSKMSDRGQFGKATVEGPLDIDCAVSRAAAERKGLHSIVTGDVDIYVVPEIDTGYLFAESLAFFGKMRSAGVVMGTSSPVIINLPFISADDKAVEIALACLMCRKGKNHG